jgi:surface antigen
VFLTAGLLSGLLATVGLVAPAVPAQRNEPARHPTRSVERRLCHGYSSCRSHGFTDAGYRRHRSRSFWRMYAGANCTNFVAYRLVREGLPNHRPRGDHGHHASHLDAYRWGVVYRSITDRHPTVGSVAWWAHRGRDGHVAWVESVNRDGSLTISEDSWGGHGFDWRRIPRGAGWPTGFIHFPLRHGAWPGQHGHRHNGPDALLDLETGSLVLFAGPVPPSGPASTAHPVSTAGPARTVQDPAEPVARRH